jgi:hypothetical protein
MKKVRRHSVQILIVTEHSAEKLFVTPEWIKTAKMLDAEKFVSTLAEKIKKMEEQDSEMEKMNRKNGHPLPTDAQILQFING